MYTPFYNSSGTVNFNIIVSGTGGAYPILKKNYLIIERDISRF